MRSLTLIILFVMLVGCADTDPGFGEYTESDKFPFGRVHPQAAEQLKDYEDLIGICDCWSVRRNPDGSWQDTLGLTWRFKYIMNGTSIQDETWKSDETYATSIRQYDEENGEWVVSYYASGPMNATPGVWRGGMVNDEIVLDMDQPSPTGLPGISRLRFHDIAKEGFQWTGAWVDSAQTFSYPFWKIGCEKRYP